MIENKDILWQIDEKLNLDWSEMFQRYIKDQLIRKWNTYYMNCPFHWENTASFWISFQKKIMKCFWCWKFYNNVLKFLRDHLMLSNQWLIDMLIKDWYIQDLKDVLWERYNDYLTHDIKKNLYQKIEDKWSENEKIFKRILFYNKWIWLITEDKIKIISDEIEKKYKKIKDWEKSKTILSIFKEIQDNVWSYWLINNEYNFIWYYSLEKWTKSLKSKDESHDVMYVYNDSLEQKIQEIINDQSLFNLFIKNWDLSLLNNWKETKISSLQSQSRSFKKFIEHEFWNSKKYFELLLSLFLFKDQTLQYSVWEWFFDMYSLWMYSLPFFTWWTMIWEKKIYKFIKQIDKRVKNTWIKSDINIYFDNDKAWLLWTIKFINQFLKFKTREIKRKLWDNSDLNLKIFDFETFWIWIKKLFSVLLFIAKKQNQTIQEYIEQIKKIIISWNYDPIFQYDLLNTWFFKVFEEVQTDHWILMKLKKQYWWNFSEEDKHNHIIKDSWEFPMIIQNLCFFLDKIEQKIEDKSSFELLRNIIIWEFKLLYLKSFKTINEVIETIDRKISSKFVSRQEVEMLLFEDYIFWDWKHKRLMKLEETLTSAFDSFYSEIDQEQEALKILNFLSYQDELKEKNITTNSEIRSIKSFIKEWIDENFEDLIISYIHEIVENMKKNKFWDNEEIEQRNSRLMYNFLLLENLFIELKIWSKEDLLKRILLKMKLQEKQIEDIMNWKNEFLTTNELRVFKRFFDHYIEVYEILKNKIISEIKSFASQDNFFDTSLFWEAFIFLIENIKKNIQKEVIEDEKDWN